MKANKIYSLLIMALLLVSCGNDDDPVNVLDQTKIAEVEDFVDVRDGRTYKCVKIGNQIWMAENLAYYIPGGMLEGCTTWGEGMIDMEKLEEQLSVEITKNKWAELAEDIYYNRGYNWQQLENDPWGLDDFVYYDVYYMYYPSGMSVEEAEAIAVKFPVFYSLLQEELASLAPDRDAILKEHTDAAEAANGGYAEKNGYLYTLDGAKAAVPEGWRLPSDDDWKELEAALGIQRSELGLLNAWRGVNAGDFLKLGGSSLFEARFAGCNAWVYGKEMNYMRLNDSAYFWASDEKSVLIGDEKEDDETGDTTGEEEETGPQMVREGIIRQLSIYSSQIWRGTTRLDNGYRGIAYSVRCVKDAN